MEFTYKVPSKLAVTKYLVLSSISRYLIADLAAYDPRR